MDTIPGSPDPYRTLGIARSASDAELRAAYRRLVQLHHPDHNGGSAESARRFEEVQEAYAQARRSRQSPGRSTGDRAGDRAGDGSGPPRPPSPGDGPELQSRLAEMERELKAARDAREQAIRDATRAREQAVRDAREAAAGPGGARPSDEELGYFSTDDSFSKIIDDAAAELSHRFSDVRESPATKRVSDLIDDLASRLTGKPPDRH
jgi:hypothetical protein